LAVKKGIEGEREEWREGKERSRRGERGPPQVFHALQQ